MIIPSPTVKRNHEVNLEVPHFQGGLEGDFAAVVDTCAHGASSNGEAKVTVSWFMPMSFF